MQTNPYLFFSGQCEAAFKFYAQCFGGKIVAMMTYGDMPAEEQTDPSRSGAIVHACMAVGNTVLMGGDAPTQHYSKPQGFFVSLSVETPGEAERIFAELAEDGAVSISLAETFWTTRFGMVTDRFGTPWMVMCGQAA